MRWRRLHRTGSLSTVPFNLPFCPFDPSFRNRRLPRVRIQSWIGTWIPNPTESCQGSEQMAKQRHHHVSRRHVRVRKTWSRAVENEEKCQGRDARLPSDSSQGNGGNASRQRVATFTAMVKGPTSLHGLGGYEHCKSNLKST